MKNHTSFKRKIANASILILFLLFSKKNTFAQGLNCAGAQPFCTDNGAYSFPNTTDNNSEVGPNYGCLGSQPNPAWYFCKIKDPGNLTIKIKQRRRNFLGIWYGIDVDFICWGPFNSLASSCSNLTAGNTVDCSYSTSATEYCDIVNAQTGQYYLLLLTNFDNRSGEITFEKDGGTGTTDCCAIDADPKWSKPNNKCIADAPYDLNPLITGRVGGIWRGPGTTAAGIFDPSIAGIGVHTIYYKASNGLCTDSISNDIEVSPMPQVAYSASSVCLGIPTVFNNTSNISSGNIATYEWTFDNVPGAATSLLQNPNYTYASCTGPFVSSLKATSDKGCVATKTLNVTVYCKPTADFAVADACANEYITLTNNSVGAITSQWDYQSDNLIDYTGTTPPPFYYPEAAGTYFINLIAQNTNCADNKSIQIKIHPVPVANFAANSQCINTQPILYDANTSYISSGLNTTYAWAYGDASTGNGVTGPHTFVSSGIYNTTLTVTSDKGCIATKIKSVEIYPKPIVNITNSTACDTKPMTFNAVSQTGSGNIVAWLWDFNNSIASLEASGQTTSFVFPTAGPQNVSLIAETDNGCRETITKAVFVDDVPKPLFDIDNPSGCPLPHCVVFTDNTLPVTLPGINSTWKWVSGDGTIISSTSNTTQTHCYTNSSSNQTAEYDVKLVVTTNKGCSDSLEKQSLIKVYPKPLAQYITNPNDPDVATPLVHFNNESLDYNKWWWYFGDTSPIDSTNNNPTHFYSSESADFYNSFLVIKNQYGCKDTAYVKVDIGPGFTFYMPEAFTPGSEDGINDVFTGKGLGIVEFEMQIFDRWGANIYTTDDINNGWNGNMRNGDIAKQDVYVWRVKLKDALNKKHEYVGHVTLLR